MAQLAEFDTHELDEYSQKMINLAREKMPKEIDRFLKAEARHERNNALKIARASVKKKTGNYFKGFKVSKVFTFDHGEARAVRSYIGNPAFHAGFIERGHKILTHKKIDTGKRSKKFEIMKQARNQYESEFIKNCHGLVDRLLEKGL